MRAAIDKKSEAYPITRPESLMSIALTIALSNPRIDQPALDVSGNETAEIPTRNIAMRLSFEQLLFMIFLSI